MNTLENKIQTDLTNAIKSKDLKKAIIIRGIKSAFALFKTAPDGKKEPDDSDLLQIIQKLVEKRKKTGDLYKRRVDQIWQKVSMQKVNLFQHIYLKCLVRKKSQRLLMKPLLNLVQQL